ncbi:glycoside hydrolase family 18 protein [Gloeophyllum trabeum ATCC 11539]|uniref:Glycoside hydrolase family 18 protein n=1 Tax=Gloeophyllum trabeum (strain ATCC 11539 / FP-39264 / Madison 617) TaxID=670483 RepID=S7RLR5_GLOTA|nr:glycoside hydrolase family 18 protein [Gloeophyllum trabeum ATCC 11539]EPQ53629.1 glycoside hydrolase family 18 protein [Gloeophyllum trabeum ATCC 11539]
MCTLKRQATTVTPSGSTGSGNTTSNSGDVIAASWYAGWNYQYFAPSNISWSKYSTVYYAFAETTPDSSTISLTSDDTNVLPQFVSLAHQNNVKAVLTIGGWSGSQYFSSSLATADNRTAFINAVTKLVSQYDLDGVDFDWEYPGKQGLGCNTISDNDSANFLSMLQELRSQPAGKNLTLSAAVSITPFVGSGGTPMSDVSAFASVLDYIEIMNYDIWGSWSTGVGPNAPLDDSCAPPADQQGSATSAVKAWTAAKMPADQIILGVASYGHSFSVSTSAASNGSSLAAYPAFNKAEQPDGDKWSGDATFNASATDACGNPVTKSGIFDFWGMVDGGFLTANGSVAEGMMSRYDECSQTPYVYNPNTQVMISYDNAQSFAAKGQFINTQGLAGFAMWETGGDLNDVLLDAISQGAGVDSSDSFDDC